MVGSELLDAALRLPVEQFGLLLVFGTLWLGALCLINALRCGRAHCWFDGTVLPALAIVGIWNLVTPLRLSWTTYLSAFWAILIASVILECAIGSYPTGWARVRGGRGSGPTLLTSGPPPELDGSSERRSRVG